MVDLPVIEYYTTIKLPQSCNFVIHFCFSFASSTLSLKIEGDKEN